MKKSFYWAARLLCVSCKADDTPWRIASATDLLHKEMVNF